MEFVKKRYIPRTLYSKRAFAGYCPQVGLRDSQWFREENLSTRAYPYLRPRAPRRKLSSNPIQAIGSMNGLCILQDHILKYGDTEIAIPVTDGKKELLSFGAYVIVMPDMVWVNTADQSFGTCEVSEEFETEVGISWCDIEGNPLETVVDGDTEPDNTQQFWLDTTVSPGVLREYSQETGKWREVLPTCIRLTGENIGLSFPVGSRILFENCPPLAPYVGTGLCRVLASGRDFLAVEGKIDSIRKEMGRLQLMIRAPMPLMDHLISHENRLWGCRYGKDHDGNFVNEIYASALGDFTVWYRFRGIASDSYVLSLGAEGPFTGAAVVGGYPVFFKENSIHKIYGSDPGSYRLQSVGCVGMAPGSHKSGAMLDHGLIYLGTDGFYRYDGSLPRKISKDLDGQSYGNGVSGVMGSIYYACVKEGKKNTVILTYDGEKDLWHRETGPAILAFQNTNGVLYYITEEDGLYAIGTEEGQPAEKTVPWEAVTGLIRRQEDKEGHFTALRLRLTMEAGSSLSVFADYDSRGVWESLGQIGGVGKTEGREIPLRIRRCDHFRLRLKGRGDITLYDLRIEMEG